MASTSRHSWLLWISVGLLLSGCSSTSRNVQTSRPKIVALNYLGEIKGNLDGLPLRGPTAVTADPAGNLYILDQGNNRVLKMNQELRPIKSVGGFGSEASDLKQPVDLVSDGGISFYILDQGNRRLVKTDYNLLAVDQLRFDDNPTLETVGSVDRFAISPYGRIYLLDPENSRVVVLAPDYSVERELSTDGTSGTYSAIAVAADGKVYLYNWQLKTIDCFDAFGSRAEEIPLSNVGKIGDLLVIERQIVATDEQYNLIVVLQLDNNSETPLYFSSAGTSPLNAPSGVAVRYDNKLFVCDTGNNRVTYYEIISR